MAYSREFIQGLISKVQDSKMRLMADNPFFASLALSLSYSLDLNEKSVSTDGKTIFFNPEFLSSLTIKEVDISILHEVIHIALKHPMRYKKFAKDPLYHLACDIVVNSNIIYSIGGETELYIKGKKLPHTVPNGNEGYNYSALEVYSMILEDEKEISEYSSSNESSNDSKEADTVRSQAGPIFTDVVMKAKSDFSGKVLFRQEIGCDYIKPNEWTLAKTFDSFKNAPETLLLDKVTCDNKRTVELEILDKEVVDRVPIPWISLDSSIGYMESDISTIKTLNSKYNLSFLPVDLNLDYVRSLRDKEFSKKSLSSLEKRYRDYVYKTYLNVKPFHKKFFLNLASKAGITGKSLEDIYKLRSLIASSITYDARFNPPKNKEDELMYVMVKEKRGICTHFASALTLLYRSLGIPSRIVFGYSMNLKPNVEREIYKEEGHAWVEVYIDNLGFVEIDPTPISSNSGRSSSQSDSSGDDKSFDSSERWQNAEDNIEDEIDSKLVEGLNIKDSLNRGIIPGHLETAIRELKKPTLDWRVLLNDFIQEDIVDFTFTVPDTRFQDSDFILPSFSLKDESVKNILFMIDTSGSMSDESIKDCYSEIDGAIKGFNNNFEGKVGYFDAIVHKVYDIDSTTDILSYRPIGRGGTDFECIFNHIKDNMMDDLPVAIIILTDGEAPYPKEKNAMGIPVLWIIDKNDQITPPWGKVARIK